MVPHLVYGWIIAQQLDILNQLTYSVSARSWAEWYYGGVLGLVARAKGGLYGK